MTPNIRRLADWNQGYHRICREERNVAAILYHLLLREGNLERFLAELGCAFTVNPDELGIFFEYAYLRDLWETQLKNDPAKAREVIQAFLPKPKGIDLANLSILEWNTFFGAMPRASKDYIQSPGNWSIARYKDTIGDDEFFLRVSRFKWAFNAKPDIVIHTDHDTAICIEAKIESGEGYYPTKREEIDEFRRRGLSRVGQTELQKYIMEDLLGIKSQFAFLVQNPRSTSLTHASVSWRDAFGALDTTGAPRFVRKWIERL